MGGSLQKKPAPGDTKTELYAITVPPCQKDRKLPPLTPEEVVDIYGQDILPMVIDNLCKQHIDLFRLEDQINEIKQIIPKLPVITNQISLRGLYERMLPKMQRDYERCRRHIRFLGRCYDILKGTAIFTHRPVHYQMDAAKIKQEVNIADVISQEVELRQSGHTLKGRCPFHNDRNPSFVVYPDNGNWWCFACNEGGDVITYIQKLRHSTFREALAELQRI